MPRFIYIIRHGETDWNRFKRFQGQTDIALNNEGRLQAARLAAKLTEVLPFDRIVSSDLIRARETAEILNRGYGTPIETDQDLREMNFGQWEGLDNAAIQSKWPGEFQEWLASGRLTVPGGETQEQLFERVWPRFRYWADRTDYEKMALVCHGGASGVLICGVLGEPPRNMRLHMPVNTGIHLVTAEGPGNYTLEVNSFS